MGREEAILHEEIRKAVAVWILCFALGFAAALFFLPRSGTSVHYDGRGDGAVYESFGKAEGLAEETERGIAGAGKRAQELREGLGESRVRIEEAVRRAGDIAGAAEEGERNLADCENLLRIIQERGRKDEKET